MYPDGARGFISAFQIQKPVYAWQNDSFSIKDEDAEKCETVKDMYDLVEQAL